MLCANCGMSFPDAVYEKNKIRKWCDDCRLLGKQQDSHALRCRRKGITIIEFDQLMNVQKNRCAICKEPFFDTKSALIEHDHLTKKLRGLTCKRCNNFLGVFADNPIEIRKRILLLEAMIEYLEGNCILERKVKFG